MARPLINTRLISAIARGVSISRRGYSVAAASSSAAKGSSRIMRAGQEVKMGVKENSESNSWVPDPVTGYYRPANQACDVDVAELREMLLAQKKNHF